MIHGLTRVQIDEPVQSGKSATVQARIQKVQGDAGVDTKCDLAVSWCPMS